MANRGLFSLTERIRAAMVRRLARGAQNADCTVLFQDGPFGDRYRLGMPGGSQNFEIATRVAAGWTGTLRISPAGIITNLTGVPLIANNGSEFTAATLAANLGLVRVLNLQAFTASGTYTPRAGMLFNMTCGVAAGGGGAGIAGSVGQALNAQGGGGGEFGIKIFSAATIGASKAVAIGAAGSAGASGNNNGGAGGDTTLGGTLFVAKGGGGATSRASTNLPGVGGTGGTYDFGYPGQTPSSANSSGSSSFGAFSGPGGNSAFGYGGGSQTEATGAQNGLVGTGYGAGGSGGASFNSATNALGGAGLAGAMYILELCTN